MSNEKLGSIDDYLDYFTDNLVEFDRNQSSSWLFEYASQWADIENVGHINEPIYLENKMLDKLHDIYEALVQIKYEHPEITLEFEWPNTYTISTIVEHEYREKYKTPGIYEIHENGYWEDKE